jgi:glycosyltransferase involved in cell wall biosynthesis
MATRFLEPTGTVITLASTVWHQKPRVQLAAPHAHGQMPRSDLDVTTNQPCGPMRHLLVVTECETWRWKERYWGPRHFVNELDLWARMFPELEMLARLCPGPPSNDAIAFGAPNIRVCDTPTGKDGSLSSRLRSLPGAVRLVRQLDRAIARADVVHVRAPCRQAFLALWLLRRHRKHTYAKYAAVWRQPAQQPITYRMQRTLLRRLPPDSVVTVYGRLPGDPPHVRTSYTSSLTETELEACRRITRQRRWPVNNRLIWVGRFAPVKDVPTLLQAVRHARDAGLDCTLDLVGDGPMRSQVEHLMSALHLQEAVRFQGRCGREVLLELLNEAKCFVLPSRFEGCPKVLVEAMAVGLPCLATNVGFLPQVLGYGERGVLVPVSDPVGLSSAIRAVCNDRHLWSRLSDAGARWASNLSIESIVDQYRVWMEEAWGCRLPSVLG